MSSWKRERIWTSLQLFLWSRSAGIAHSRYICTCHFDVNAHSITHPYKRTHHGNRDSKASRSSHSECYSTLWIKTHTSQDVKMKWLNKRSTNFATTSWERNLLACTCPEDLSSSASPANESILASMQLNAVSIRHHETHSTSSLSRYLHTSRLDYNLYDYIIPVCKIPR